LYSIKNELKNFWLKDYGWLLLMGIAIFSLRSSTLWLSRDENTIPDINQILVYTGSFLASLTILIIVIIVIRSIITMVKSFNTNRYLKKSNIDTSELLAQFGINNKNIKSKLLHSYQFAEILRSTLTYTITTTIITGLIIAWSLNLEIFGGVLDSILTIIQIIAGAIPLLNKIAR